MTALQDAANDLRIDPTGMTDRELAIVLLRAFGIDLDQPAGPMVGDTLPIRDHDSAYLIERALCTARYEPRRERTA